MKTRETPPLMDWMRPLESDGALHSVLLSTYGLSLSDPPFFEQDFLPTLLGLGGVRDRGYSSPSNVERRLGQIYCGLVCDAHTLAQGGRPSLRVDVIPIGRQLHHAKVVLIHRERLVRLVIASANLTHEGFRRNREAAGVLDFHERSELTPSILADFASQWLVRLGSAATQDFHRALEEAVTTAQAWKPARTGELTVRTLWGGGEVPLWRQVVEVWPQGELLREWQICSPFWPSPGEADTPFDVFRRELDARGANVTGAKLKLFALADVPGSRGRPCFPFPLVEQLAQRGFNPADATICPARLDALDTEVPDGKAEDQRPLHAKWIFLRGERISLLLLGSANFTRRGLGVLRNPTDANVETGVLLSGPAKTLSTDSIVPPVAESGIVNWRDCRAESVATPQTEIEMEPWPEFINGIELEVRWESLPVAGTLRVRCSAVADFSLAWERDDELVTLSVGAPSAEGILTIDLDEAQIFALLVRRRVIVRWGEPIRHAFFPLNIASNSKPGLPAVLGQDPTEQDLLAYFHGRIDEEDLMNLLMERGRQKEAGQQAALAPPGRELQNYVVREFLEGLYGMEDVLRDSTASPRIFEQALLGEFSPVRLANETQRAFASGRRTATATGFQLVELLRLVENLAPRDQEKHEPNWFAATRERSLEQLLRIVGTAGVRAEFRESCDAPSFREFVQTVLKTETAARWWTAIEQR
jgi:phosphatidylserine/phosphatidylglycerophosphate/cardiolipin synthase-like enzyme